MQLPVRLRPLALVAGSGLLGALIASAAFFLTNDETQARCQGDNVEATMLMINTSETVTVTVC